MAEKSVLSGSKYHDPAISTTTDPVTGKPWSAKDRKQVEQLNSLAGQFHDAVTSGNTEQAQIILQKRDDILDNADDDVQTGFMAVALASMAAGIEALGDDDEED